MSHTKKAAVTRLAPRPIASLVHQRHVGGDRRIHLSLHFGNPSPALRPATRWRSSALVATGHALVRVVTAIGIRERSHEDELVHHLSHARKHLTDFDPRHVRLDRREFTANLGRCLRLGIPHVDVRRPAGKIDVDDRLVRSGGLRLTRYGRLRPQDIAQADSPECHASHREKIAAGNPITEPAPSGRPLTENREHESSSREQNVGNCRHKST